MDSLKEDERSFTGIYTNFTKYLKKELKQFKNERNSSVSRIRFVSRTLRSKATSLHTNKVSSIDHDLELKNNFWNCVKNYLEKVTKVLPTFDKATCYKFLNSLVSVSTRLKSFEFHLGYNLFDHQRKHLILIHQPTL